LAPESRVGDLIGSGASQEQAVVGETPNVGARLQSIAEPNTVVIAESTRKLLGNLFELQDLGAQDLPPGVPLPHSQNKPMREGPVCVRQYFLQYCGALL
jgi:hypothetical protein